MIDTHCHLDAERFAADRSDVLSRAWAAGVSAIVIPAVAPATWDSLVTLSRTDSRLWIGLGIHPQFLPDMPEAEDDAALERLDFLLGQGGALAVGECGLDGPSVSGASLERQVRVLRGHLKLARKHNLPLLLHCLRAHPALRELFNEEALPDAGAVMHSYSGGVDLVKIYVRFGCHISFAGPVSYAEARKPIDALKVVPADRLLAETDAPDQAPHPFRGQRSEPAYVREVIQGMARALGEPEDVVMARTSANARALFRR